MSEHEEIMYEMGVDPWSKYDRLLMYFGLLPSRKSLLRRWDATLENMQDAVSLMVLSESAMPFSQTNSDGYFPEPEGFYGEGRYVYLNGNWVRPYNVWELL